jgi:hypothetical protein
MPTPRNLAVSPLYLSGVTKITCTLQATVGDRNLSQTTFRYETQISNNFGEPMS